MLPIDVLQTENELAEEFLAALARRHLPEKFFYWFPLSVKAWLDLCRVDQPYKNFARSFGLIAKHADEISCHLAPPSVEVFSLGAGQGDKDLVVLEALRARGITVHYRPVDSSQALVELAVGRAREAGIAARGLKADLAGEKTRAALAAEATAPRLFLLLGNTLGALDPPRFLEALRTLLRPEDRILIDGEIFDPNSTMAGYDNPVNRRFAFAPLASLGLEEGRDGELVFAEETDSRVPGLHRVSKHFRAARLLETFVAGQRFVLEAGEKISMSPSSKYTRATFAELLRESGRLRPLAPYLSDDERFVMALAAPHSI